MNTTIRFRQLALQVGGVALLLLLCACALKKPPSTPVVVKDALPPTTKIPDQWTSADSNAAAVETGWLKAFNDPQMEAIVDQAIKNNLDLKAAATMSASSCQCGYRSTRSDDAYDRSRGRSQVFGRFHQTDGQGQTRGNFNASRLLGGVSWELDIWVDSLPDGGRQTGSSGNKARLPMGANVAGGSHSATLDLAVCTARSEAMPSRMLRWTNNCWM